MFDSHKIEFPDGTQLIIKQDSNKENVIDIFLVHCHAAIIPEANNHIKLVKINKAVPKLILQKLKKAGVIDE